MVSHRRRADEGDDDSVNVSSGLERLRSGAVFQLERAFCGYSRRPTHQAGFLFPQVGKWRTSLIEVSPATTSPDDQVQAPSSLCGGAPYSSASSKKPNLRRASSSLKPSALNTMFSNVAAMNTNRARAQLDPVQHHVIPLRTAACRVCSKLLNVLVMYRCERMMRGIPTALFFIPLEHR